jgi:hypothetical protein
MTVVWEHVSYQLGDRCSYSRHCLLRPRWVVQVGHSHRLACIWHRPR